MSAIFVRSVSRRCLLKSLSFRTCSTVNAAPTRKSRVDAQTIALLERLSLVDCANRQSIETLEAAIEFADEITLIDTTGVTPLVTLAEDRWVVIISFSCFVRACSYFVDR